MKHLSYHFWQNTSLFSEARLCFQRGLSGPTGPSSTPSSTPSEPEYANSLTRFIDKPEHQAWVEWFSQKSTMAISEVIVWGGETIISIPIGVLKGLKETWDNHKTDRQEMMRVLGNIGEFFRGAPILRNIFESNLRKEDMEHLKELTDQVAWISLFRDHPDALTDVLISNAASEDHPEITAFLERLSIDDRQRMFIEYIDRFLPPAQRNKLHAGGEVATPAQRFKSIVDHGNLKTISGTFGAMLGMTEKGKEWDKNLSPDERAVAEDIARQALTEYYKDPSKVNRGQWNKGITGDFKSALQYERLAGFRPAATNASIVKESLPLSKFKGALELGVIDNAEMERLYKGLEHETHMLALSESSATTQLNRLTGAVDKQNQKEAMTMLDVFQNMNGIEKMILILGTGFLLMKSSAARWGAAGLGAVYFAQKFLLKNEDPLKTWSLLANKGVEKAKGGVASLLGKELTPGYVDQVGYRANIMFRYLSENDKQNIENQVKGLTLIGDMRLKDLATYFEMKGAYGEQWHLQVEDPTFKRMLTQAMEKSDWKPSGFRAFFGNSENVAQVTEGLGFMFYNIARNNPAYDDDRELVERVSNRLPEGASVSRLGELNQYNYATSDPDFHQEILAANAAYIRLVVRGKGEAANMNMTLTEFVAGSLGVAERAPEKVAKPEGKGGIPEESISSPGGMPEEGASHPGGIPEEGEKHRGGTPERGEVYRGGRPEEGTSDRGGTPIEGVKSRGGTPEEGASSRGGTPAEGIRSRGGKPEEGVKSSGRTPDESKSAPGKNPEESASKPGNKPETGKPAPVKKPEESVSPPAGKPEKPRSKGTKPSEGEADPDERVA